MTKPFIHLHVHGEYSLKDATAKHDALVEKAKELGMDSLAITDHGAVFGDIDFYKKCKAKEIKPILGCETYVAPRRNTLKDGKNDDANYHLVLLCENNTGWKNLIKIVSNAAVEGFYYKPRTDKEHLQQYHEGLIALSACLGGEVQEKLLGKDYDTAKEAALQYDAIFGRGNFFLELQNHGIPDQPYVNEMLIKMSAETGIPLIATNDTHYIKREDAVSHDILMALQAGTTVDDTKRKKYPTDQFYFKSQDEMWDLFGDIAPQALENTVLIAKRCNVEIEFGKYKIPKFPKIPPEFKSSTEFIRKLANDGLRERYRGPHIERIMRKFNISEPEAWKLLQERLDYELSVIDSMHFNDYFLIIWDFLYYYQHDLDGPLSPGRGSGAGSIVAFSLSITHVEPIFNGLIFERFLSPNRVTMPDIDMDFCIYLREFVINHVIELYGKDNVSQIITFGTYAARAAIRAVGRALAVPYAIVDKVAKLVPFEPKMTINKALDMSKDLRSLYTMNTHIKTLIDHALAIEGLPSSTSTHAAGVLICPGPVTDYVPVWVNDGVIVEQFNMNEIEELGLLKMDFLGLRNLSVINQTLKWIKANHGETITHKELLETIYDKRSYILLGKGLTAGIFQMEGEGMTQFMMQLKPQTFEEWTAGIALYRPGPMGFIPTFLANRDHPENIKYLHPKLEPILAETYGVITYQEQCMFIAVDLAGYSQADSDDFRRAISKKKKYLMELHQGWFIKGREEDIDKVKNKIIPAIPGAIHCQISEDTATEIFNQMMDFASYAFNKSHAAAYAVLGCETGWLKYVYPVEFMASLMTSVSGDLSKVGKYIRHCERDLNIRVLPPDINISTDQFVPTKSGEIRFGLTAAKNVGENVIKDIIKEREINGKFKSFTDFINRTSGIADKQTIESLIRCGAFDFTGEKRAQLLYILDDTAESAAKQRQKKKEGQMKLFWPDMNIKDVVPDIAEYPKKIYLSAEKEILGIYVSGHPLDAIKVYADKVSTIKTSDLVFPDEDDNPTEENIVEPLPFFDGQTVRLVCIITKIHTILDKHNNQMAFVTVEDLYGSVELVVFASLYDILKDIIVEDNIIEVNGRISVKDNGVNILPNTIQLVDIKAITKVYAQISSMNDFVNVIMSIKGNSGSMPVYVLFNNWSMLLPKQYWTNDQGIRTLKKNNINVYLKEDQV